jgi:ABC-type lipoprotein export system ATPase subunit
MDILAEQAAHGALVLIPTHSDHIARLCDRAISLDSTDNATEVLSASIHVRREALTTRMEVGDLHRRSVAAGRCS